MSAAKKDVVSSKNEKEYGLTKLEFTTSVFEEIYQSQQDELRLAIAGISEEYELSELVSHLEVSIDTWFRWSTEEREKYVADMNKLSVEDALGRKSIREPDITKQPPAKESTELSIDVAQFLKQNMGYKLVTAKACRGKRPTFSKPPTCHPGATNLATFFIFIFILFFFFSF